MGLLFSYYDKFVPGLDAVAPPLAGTSRTSRLRFLTLETTGRSSLFMRICRTRLCLQP